MSDRDRLATTRGNTRAGPAPPVTTLIFAAAQTLARASNDARVKDEPGGAGNTDRALTDRSDSTRQEGCQHGSQFYPA